MKTESVDGILAYLAPSVKSSLYRNGEVYTTRDKDGNDGENIGYDEEKVRAPIHHARALSESRKRNIGPDSSRVHPRRTGNFRWVDAFCGH